MYMKQSSNFLNAYLATRNSVAYFEENELRCLKIGGQGALEVLDIICPCDVFLHDGQIKHTLLLGDDGIPIADIYIGKENDEFYILGYGLTSKELTEWIKKHVPSEEDVSIIDVMKSHKGVTLDGPFSWELCAEILGSDILGLPYLGMLLKENTFIFRAGNTGEYGYHLLIQNGDYDSFIDRMVGIGNDYDLKKSSEEVKAQCVLENFVFDIEQEGKLNLSVMELQLQWRISRLKSHYPGAKSISKIRNSGWNRRLTCFTSEELIEIDATLTCYGEPIGKVVAFGYSPLREEYVGKAIINSPYWHSGIDDYYAGKVKIQTISAPSVFNRSLGISPYRDSYSSRKRED